MAKNKDSLTGITIGGLIGLNVVGSIPSTPESAGIKSGFSTGVSKVGSTLPTLGKIKGTTMVVKSLKKLKPVKFKGMKTL